MNLFGIILARRIDWIDRYVVNHELIHTAQQRELLFIPFFILYIMEWLVRLVQDRDRDAAYRNISFEREAYGHGADLGYLRRRRRYAWLRYMRQSEPQ